VTFDHFKGERNPQKKEREQEGGEKERI